MKINGFKRNVGELSVFSWGGGLLGIFSHTYKIYKIVVKKKACQHAKMGQIIS